MDHHLHRDNNRSFLSEAASWLFISLWPGEEVGTGWGAGGKSTSKEAKGEILEWPLFLFHFSLVVGEYQWSVSISIRSTDLMPQAWALLLLSTRWRSSFIVYSFEILPYYVSNSLKKKKKDIMWHQGTQGFTCLEFMEHFQMVPSRQVWPRFCGASVLFYLLESVRNPFVCARLMC